MQPILFLLNRTVLGGKGKPPLERKLPAGPFASDPAVQRDWPNPVLRPYAQVFTGFVAGTSVALITALSAVVPRAPTQYQVPARAVQQPFLYGTPTNLLATPAVPNPANQYDWPNPQTRKANPDLYNWTQSLLTVIVPFSQNDWPNPIIARRLPDYTWVQSPQPSATVVNVPFNQTDWPNPQIARRIDYTWVQSGLPYSTVGRPFAQYDWPVPRGPVFSNDLRTWLQFPIIATPVPANQFDWPNPRGATYAQDLRTWLQFTILPAPIAVPSNQYDWPNPRSAQRPVSLSWEQVPPLSLSVGTPFSQTDWPNPLRGLYNIAYQGFIGQSPINLGIPPAPTPPSPAAAPPPGGATIGDPYARAIIEQQIRELNEREQHEADKRQRDQAERARDDKTAVSQSLVAIPAVTPLPTQRLSRDSVAVPGVPAQIDIGSRVQAVEQAADHFAAALKQQEAQQIARQAQLDAIAQHALIIGIQIDLAALQDEDDLDAVLALLLLL